MQTAKQAAKQIIDHVSDQATWDNIMYELYVKQKIEKGLSAIDESRVISSDDAKKRLLGNEQSRKPVRAAVRTGASGNVPLTEVNFAKPSK